MPSLKLLLSVAFFFLSPAAAGRLRTRPRPEHQSRPQPRPRPSPALETIETDVLVIGGGSAGTYGAIRLHDAGKSVVVVEATGKLGGHAQTYVGDNGGVVNVGVQILYDLPVVTDYFDRLGVNLTTAPPYTASGISSVNADFALGVAIPTTNVTLATIAPALQRYGEYLAANLSTVYPGYALPDPVPEDLLLPFGEFATKYGLESIVNIINLFIQPGEAWRDSTLYALKLLDSNALRGIVEGYKVTRDVNDLYRAAAAVLGDRVLFNSTVVSLRRGSDGECLDSGSGVEAIVRTSATGPPTRILASKVLMAAPPVADNLVGWDLDPAGEAALFGKFKVRNYQAGVIRNAALPTEAPLQNVGIDTPFNIPALPALFNVVRTALGPGYGIAYYTGPGHIDVPAAQADTLATLGRLAANGVIEAAPTEILAWYDHANVRMYVEPEDVRAGFYRDLYALQGQRNTFWSGAAWVTQASSPIWDYTKGLVDESILAALAE